MLIVITPIGIWVSDVAICTYRYLRVFARYELTFYILP